MAQTGRSEQESSATASESFGLEGDFCSSRIFVALADGSSGAVQVGDPELDARSPVWSPDGSTIAFGGGDASTGIALYPMAADGSDVRRIGDVSGGSWSFIRLGWSPDGTRIVATAGEEWLEAWVVAAEGGSETKISGDPVDPAVIGNEIFPAYAPDGAIAWARSGIPSRPLVLMEPGRTPVGFPGLGGIPVWSPDGLLIAKWSDESTVLTIIDRSGQVVATIEDVGSVPGWQRVTS